MSALDKVLRLSGSPAAAPEAPALDDELLLSVQAGIRELSLLLAADPDDEDDDEDDEDDDSNDSSNGDDDHTGHATYKALMAKKVAPAKASKMCAQADKKVKASALTASLGVILAGQPGREVTLVTLSADTAPGRIADARQLHAAAVLALSGQGRHGRQEIRSRARELGVDVGTLPGFGGSSARDEQAAAEMVTLAGKTGAIMAMHHGLFTGKHSHGHPVQTAHDHDHEHFNDNRHDGGPLHRPGSAPRHDTGW